MLGEGEQKIANEEVNLVFEFPLLTQIELPVNTQSPRWGHSATAITLPNGNEEVILFGGCSDHYYYGWEKLLSKSILHLIQLTTIFFGTSLLSGCLSL